MDATENFPTESNEVVPTTSTANDVSEIYPTETDEASPRASTAYQVSELNPAESNQAGPRTSTAYRAYPAGSYEADPSTSTACGAYPAESYEAGPSTSTAYGAYLAESYEAGPSTSTAYGAYPAESYEAGPSTSTASGAYPAESSEAGPSTSTVPVRFSVKLQYQVQHGYFNWTINNFSAFPDVNDKYCLSPAFILKETWWYLTLHPKAKIFGKDKISLNLIRHKSDRGPTTVSASYRIGLENYKNKVWFKPQEGVVFGKGDSYGFQTCLLGHLEDFLLEGVENDCDSLSVLCEIYVTYVMSIYRTGQSVRKSTVDSDLALNLLNMYNTQSLNDILIEIPSKRVRAHKCVLCARSKYFARLLEDGKSFIQLYCTPSCLYCALMYMYTASFYYMGKNALFSIGLYELACQLSLHKLRDLLTPRRIEMKSRIVVDSLTIACTLQEFQIADIFCEAMHSAVYSDETTGIGISVHLQEMTNLDYLDFCVKVSGIVEALHFSFQMYLLNRGIQPAEMIPAISQDSKVKFNGSVFTYTVRFSVIDILNSCMFDNNLYFKFACKRFSLTHSSNPPDTLQLPVPPVDPEAWVEDLSSDLVNLYRSGYQSDVTLVAKFDQTFKVHRSVLAARSPFFQRLFAYNRYKNELMTLTDMGPRNLDFLLTFIYSGKIRNINKIDVLDLYECSEQFSMRSLKRKSEAYLTLNLDPEFVFEVMSAANFYNNSKLIDSCSEYIERYFSN